MLGEVGVVVEVVVLPFLRGGRQAPLYFFFGVFDASAQLQGEEEEGEGEGEEEPEEKKELAPPPPRPSSSVKFPRWTFL